MTTKQITQRCVLMSIAIAFAIACSVSTASAQSAQTLSQLAWMAGGWRTAPGSRLQIEEHWMSPAGSSMLGMGRTVSGKGTVEFEFLRLEQRPDGIYYVASPNGRCPSTDFKLTKLSGQEAMFENPKHDFPKRITYRKNSNGSLTAIVDGGEGTKGQRFDYVKIEK